MRRVRNPSDFYISGESLSSNRLILSVTALDLVRQVEGTAPPVDVRIENFGNEGLPISVRLVPIIMMYALFIAGAFVPASSLVEEKENGTLSALLVSPVRASEVLVAKAILGTILAFVMAFMTLFMNNALARPLACCRIWRHGVRRVLDSSRHRCQGQRLYVRDVKGSGFRLFGPVIFYVSRVAAVEREVLPTDGPSPEWQVAVSEGPRRGLGRAACALALASRGSVVACFPSVCSASWSLSSPRRDRHGGYWWV